MVYVELEILYLLLILHMVCKLKQSHVTTMKMSLMKFVCHPKIPKKVWRWWCMWSLRYQLWSLLGIPDLQIVPKPPDKYDGIIDEILLLPPTISDKVWRQWCMWNLRYQIWSSFCIWFVNCSQIAWKSWRTSDIKSGPHFASGL